MFLFSKTFRSLILTIILGVVIFFAGNWYFNTYRPMQEHQKAVEEYRKEKELRFIAENEKYADLEVDVAFLGDSLTDNYDLEKYYPQYLTVNRGIGGDTTFDLENRLKVSVYDLQPKVAVMLIGANNTDTMLENYENILKGLKENLPNTKIVILSLTAMGGEIWGEKNQQAAYNNISIKLLAEKYNFTFIDLFTPLYDVSIGEVYAGYTVDGGHFSDEGYTVVTNQITPVLQTLLGK